MTSSFDVTKSGLRTVCHSAMAGPSTTRHSTSTMPQRMETTVRMWGRLAGERRPVNGAPARCQVPSAGCQVEWTTWTQWILRAGTGARPYIDCPLPTFDLRLSDVRLAALRGLLTIAHECVAIPTIDPKGLSFVVIPEGRNWKKGELPIWKSRNDGQRPVMSAHQRCLSIQWVTAMVDRRDG